MWASVCTHTQTHTQTYTRTRARTIRLSGSVPPAAGRTCRAEQAADLQERNREVGTLHPSTRLSKGHTRNLLLNT